MTGKAPGHRHLVVCAVIAATAHEWHTCDPQKITARSQLRVIQELVAPHRQFGLLETRRVLKHGQG